VSFQAGAFDAALGLVGAAEAGPLDEFQRALVDLLRAQVAFAAGVWSDAPRLLLKAAKQLEAFDLRLARETYLAAWGAAGLADDLAARDVLPEICRAVRALPSRPGASGPLDLLLDGLALLITDGYAAATPALQRAALAVTDLPVEDVLRWGWLAGSASSAMWDLEGLHALCVRQVQVVRDAGALAALPIHLAYLGMADTWLGDLGEAGSLVAEVDSVAAATGTRVPNYLLLRFRAMQGRESDRARRGCRDGNEGDPGALGGRGAVQRPRPLRGGSIGGSASHFGCDQPLDIHVVPARARRGGRAQRRHRTRT
jgi:hypothetical protein